MEIVRRPQAEGLELVVEGRLDGYWAQHLSAAIDDVLREGIHQVRLNLAAVSYISSAGIRVLLGTHQQFTALGGPSGRCSSWRVWRRCSQAADLPRRRPPKAPRRSKGGRSPASSSRSTKGAAAGWFARQSGHRG